MSSSPPPAPAAIPLLSRASLDRAIALYLAHAYPEGPVPETVSRRLAWPTDATPTDLLGRPPFERVVPPDGNGTVVYALRLGNRRYPHMKLQVQAWPSAAGFMLTVNTHDQIVGLDPQAPDAEAFRALQAENQQIKERIEQAWDAAGLPNFSRYLHDYIRNHPATTAAGPEPLA